MTASAHPQPGQGHSGAGSEGHRPGIDGLRAETFRQSNGFVGPGNANNEIPAAGPMDFSYQRLWYAFGPHGVGHIVLVDRTHLV